MKASLGSDRISKTPSGTETGGGEPGPRGGTKRAWAAIGLIALGAIGLVAVFFLVTRDTTKAPVASSATTAQPAAVAPAVVEARTAPPPAPTGPDAEEPVHVPEPAPWPEPGEPAAPLPPPPPPSPAASAPDHEHLWEVAYDRGELGSDGNWRFPHRCRTCGAELFARDVADASAQTGR